MLSSSNKSCRSEWDTTGVWLSQVLWITLATWSFPLYASAKVQVWKLLQQIWSSGKAKICILWSYLKVRMFRMIGNDGEKRNIFQSWKAKLNSRDGRVKPGSQLRALLSSLPEGPLCLLLSSCISWRRTVSSLKLWKKRAHIQRNGGYLAGWDHRLGWYPWGKPLGLCP